MAWRTFKFAKFTDFREFDGRISISCRQSFESLLRFVSFGSEPAQVAEADGGAQNEYAVATPRADGPGALTIAEERKGKGN